MNSKAIGEPYDSSESLSEDDEDGWMLTDEVEKDFYKTLSQIKNKDPEIYNKEVKFFKDVAYPEKNERKPKKSTPLTLRDYERKLVLEKEGHLSDEEPRQSFVKEEKHQPTYVEEQENLKMSLKSALNDGSEDDDDEESWGGLLIKREKTEEETEKEEKHYKDWLKGQKESASDEEVETKMKTLRDYWTDPSLNQGEQFLRDYILNKRFLEHDDKTEDPVNEEVLLKEMEEVEAEDEYEHKYNFRFEEPDQEFIKRYPRVMENSIRRKNDHRKQKRDEVKDRKLKEKEKKRAEIKHKQKLKKMEIEEKIEEIKKLTGNDQLAFENLINKDFDQDEHDKAMHRLFNEEFYAQDDPIFQPSTSEGIMEDEWNEEGYEETEEVEESLNCEDPNFNMDCDYDPVQDKAKPSESRSRRRKDKHRRTTVSEAVNKEKPTFDPTVHQSFKDYVDQYYAIDCEDFIGDLPCRFKYRQTVPNSYGLTIEEILSADDKELDRWCSIKRIQQLRPDYKEKCDLKVYKKKASDQSLKRKILPSLFKTEKEQEIKDKVHQNPEEQNPTDITKDNDVTNCPNESPTKHEDKKPNLKLRHRNKKNKQHPKNNVEVAHSSSGDKIIRKRKHENCGDYNNSKKIKRNHTTENGTGKWQVQNRNKQIKTPKTPESNLVSMSDARLLAYGIKPKKFRNKLKYKRNS